MKKSAAVIVILAFGLLTFAAERIDSDVNRRIRQEATEESRIMQLVHTLTDVHGPRLTGSPAFRTACEWSLGQLKEWGLLNTELEEWDFGHFGWSNDSYSVHVISPYRDRLEASVIAWTPSTRGVVKGKVVQINPPAAPTQEELSSWLNSIKDKVRGRIVLAGAAAVIPVSFDPPAKRSEEADLRTELDRENEDAPAASASGSSPGLPAYEMERRVDEFLFSNGALVKVVDSAREHRQLRVMTNRTYNTARAVPGIVITNDDYGRICRVLAGGTDVEMELEILNTVHPEGQRAVNVVAEIPGATAPDEIVMMGAHIDSWHAGTGATDNAAGVAVIMEAARILQKLGVKPRRTIRVVLWGGEEQGLLGSEAYVRSHFGTAETPAREFSRLIAYLNLDAGTGRVRGASVFGPPEAAAVLRAILQPFADLGVAGANNTGKRVFGGNDSTTFNRAGLPGISLLQDPIDYRTHTWHTNLDTYGRVLEEDLRQCVIVVASAVYHLANREGMLPRFSPESMPEAGSGAAYP